MVLIDTHAHLDMLKKTTPRQAVDMASEWGIKYIINVGASLEASKKAGNISKQFENVYASAGVHPHYADTYGRQEEKELISLIQSNKKAVAVGETGFDFFKNHVSKQDQEKAFRSQIEIAIENDLPVIVHDRDAHQDTYDVLKKYSSHKKFRAVLHCFSGDRVFARQIIDLGLFISFTGVLTFPNARKTVEAADFIPTDRIFVETDTPFLAPQPKRGQENQPAYVLYVAQKLAAIKKISVEQVARTTTQNAIKFFNIKG